MLDGALLLWHDYPCLISSIDTRYSMRYNVLRQCSRVGEVIANLCCHKFMLILTVMKDKDVRHHGSALEDVGLAKVYQLIRVGLLCEVPTQIFPIRSPHPFVGGDVAQGAPPPKQVVATLVEKTVDVTSGVEGFIAAVLVELSEFPMFVLQLYIWWIADDDIESIGDAKHPFHIEEG